MIVINLYLVFLNLFRHKSVETTIKVSHHTRNALRLVGRKGQTYDDIIVNLLKKAKESPVNSGKSTEL